MKQNFPWSVHLRPYPEADESKIDDSLSERMEIVRTITSLGRAARKNAKIGIRQPLGSLHIVGDKNCIQALENEESSERSSKQLICEDLNIKVLSVSELGESVQDFEDWRVEANPRALGPRKVLPVVQDELRKLSPLEHFKLARSILTDEKWRVIVEHISLSEDDLLVKKTPREGFSVVSKRGITVALNTQVTPELEREGLARELIRLVNSLRKQLGLNTEDRIVLRLSTDDDELHQAIVEHRDDIVHKVLAVQIEFTLDDGETHNVALRKQIPVRVQLAKV